MYINPQSWHARLFFQCLNIWFKFKTGYRPPSRFRENTNICFYIRTVVLWMPLVFLIHLLVAASSVYVLVIYPFTVFGYIYFVNVALFIGIIGGLVALVIGLVCGGISVGGKVRELSNRELRDGLTAREVVSEWFEAKSSKICKFVTFKREEITNA